MIDLCVLRCLEYNLTIFEYCISAWSWLHFLYIYHNIVLFYPVFHDVCYSYIWHLFDGIASNLICKILFVTIDDTALLIFHIILFVNHSLYMISFQLTISWISNISFKYVKESSERIFKQNINIKKHALLSKKKKKLLIQS